MKHLQDYWSCYLNVPDTFVQEHNCEIEIEGLLADIFQIFFIFMKNKSDYIFLLPLNYCIN